MNARNFLLVTVLVLLFSGCGLPASNVSPRPSHAAGPERAATNEGGGIKNELYTQYKEWKGVRYREGGLSKKGVDCSGFVYVTYRSRFGVKLPRTTTQLSETGEPVRRSELKTGDLVFFKTGRTIRHVGIYLEKGRFLHASKKRGVMISRLDDIYWKPRYWKAMRIDGL